MSTTRVLHTLLLISLAGRVGFLLWEPATGADVTPADITPAYWPMTLYLGGPAYLVSFVVTALLLVRLADRRVTLPAALLVGLGGTLFALTITAESLPFAWAVGLPDAAAVVEAFNGRVPELLPAILGGSFAVALGVLVALVAGGRAGTLPWWFAGAGLVYLALFVALPPLPGPVSLGLSLVEIALLAGLGTFALRAQADQAAHSRA